MKTKYSFYAMTVIILLTLSSKSDALVHNEVNDNVWITCDLDCQNEAKDAYYSELLKEFFADDYYKQYFNEEQTKTIYSHAEYENIAKTPANSLKHCLSEATARNIRCIEQAKTIQHFMTWIGGPAAGYAPTALNRAELYKNSSAKRNIMNHEFFKSGTNKKIGGVWLGAAEFSVELATIKNEARCATMKNNQDLKCKTNLKN